MAQLYQDHLLQEKSPLKNA